MDLVCQRSWPTLWYELAKRPLFQGLDLFMIGPFLGQHDVPYQQDELWLNLEERSTSQFQVHLFENSVIKGRRWIVVRLLFETRNVIHNLVINCTDPLWVDAKRQVNQQWTEETTEHSPDFWLLACVECPRQRGRIVSDIEDYKMGVICDGRCPNNMERGAIVDYDCHKFKYIDQHKHPIIVVAPESEGTLHHFIRETNVPPKFLSDGKSSSAFQQTVSNCCCKRRLRD